MAPMVEHLKFKREATNEGDNDSLVFFQGLSFDPVDIFFVFDGSSTISNADFASALAAAAQAISYLPDALSATRFGCLI
jgi:hypothetical protein